MSKAGLLSFGTLTVIYDWIDPFFCDGCVTLKAGLLSFGTLTVI